jgi:hypothetical protein
MLSGGLPAVQRTRNSKRVAVEHYGLCVARASLDRRHNRSGRSPFASIFCMRLLEPAIYFKQWCETAGLFASLAFPSQAIVAICALAVVYRPLVPGSCSRQPRSAQAPTTATRQSSVVGLVLLLPVLARIASRREDGMG